MQKTRLASAKHLFQPIAYCATPKRLENAHAQKSSAC